MTDFLKILREAQQTYDGEKPPGLEQYGLDNLDCPLCNNTGTITWRDNGVLYAKPCECMAKRVSLRRLKQSGLDGLLERYSFENYKTPDFDSLKVKHAAEMFAEADKGWLYISGIPGSGKSHICTAICSRLMERGKDVYYMKWRDDSRKLKASMNTSDKEWLMDKLKTVEVLYIDDFLKGGANDADVRLAFEILNARYINDGMTLISSELSWTELVDVDKALRGRIYEKSKGFRLESPEVDYREK